MSIDEFSSPETATAVLAFIRANPTASVRVIGEAVGIGHTTAHRAVNRLIREGALRVRRLGTGDQYATTYDVLSELDEADDFAAALAEARRDAAIDALGRTVIWARSARHGGQFTVDDLHRYALDRIAAIRAGLV